MVFSPLHVGLQKVKIPDRLPFLVNPGRGFKLLGSSEAVTKSEAFQAECLLSRLCRDRRGTEAEIERFRV